MNLHIFILITNPFLVRSGTFTMLTTLFYSILFKVQHWCPGTKIPAVCCSDLVEGNVEEDNARFYILLWTLIIQTIFRGTAIPFDRHMSFKELKPVYSYEGCYDQCLVGFETKQI